jgi:hypothetical protein
MAQQGRPGPVSGLEPLIFTGFGARRLKNAALFALC